MLGVIVMCILFTAVFVVGVMLEKLIDDKNKGESE